MCPRFFCTEVALVLPATSVHFFCFLKLKNVARNHFLLMARPRSVCFTVNNPSELELTKLKQNVAECKYGIFQLERGANGTLHVQGYCTRDKPTTFRMWKEVVGTRAHIESARGTAEENKAYCSKEDTRVEGPYEYGLLPKPGQRSDLAGIIAAARDASVTMADVLETNPEAFLKYHKGILAIRSVSEPRRSFKTVVYWYYGSTGSGKSRRANEEAPGAYWKPGGTKWWDGYDGHEDVIIDDYRRDLCPFHELLRLFDRYPLQVEVKGGSRAFVSKRIFVTTPQCPQTTWDGRSEEDIQQLLRRIEFIVNFDVTQSPDLS